jgi:hypothetical protein
MTARPLLRLALPLALTLLAAPVAAQIADGFPPEALTLMDTNRDDAVSPDEIEAFIPKIHAAMDTNEDGRLETAEAAAALSADQVAALDANADGTIAVEELAPVIRADFAAADRDGNGLID